MLERESYPYRRSTFALVCDQNDRILLVQKESFDDNEWSFPGGGVDGDETPQQALMRELGEELESEKFEIVAESKIPYTYEWPDEVIEERIQKKGEFFRGQSLSQFLVKFSGEQSEVRPGDGIRTVKWVKREDLKTHLVFPNQWENAEKLIEELVDKKVL